MQVLVLQIPFVFYMFYSLNMFCQVIASSGTFWPIKLVYVQFTLRVNQLGLKQLQLLATCVITRSG